MTMKRKYYIWLAVLALAGIVTYATVRTATWYHNFPAHHFDVVAKGTLIRCGQPDNDALGYIKNHYGIKTVVNLRGAKPQEQWYQQEKDYCARNGLELVDIDIAAPGEARVGLRRFLEIMSDKNSLPVLVHCEAGSVRTGLASGAYRIVFQHWSYDDAVVDAERFRYDPAEADRIPYNQILQELAKNPNVWRNWTEPATTRGNTTSQASGPASKRS